MLREIQTLTAASSDVVSKLNLQAFGCTLFQAACCAGERREQTDGGSRFPQEMATLCYAQGRVAQQHWLGFCQYFCHCFFRDVTAELQNGLSILFKLIDHPPNATILCSDFEFAQPRFGHCTFSALKSKRQGMSPTMMSVSSVAYWMQASASFVTQVRAKSFPCCLMKLWCSPAHTT